MIPSINKRPKAQTCRRAERSRGKESGHTTRIAMITLVYPAPGSCLGGVIRVQDRIEWIIGGKLYHENSGKIVERRKLGLFIAVAVKIMFVYPVKCTICNCGSIKKAMHFKLMRKKYRTETISIHSMPMMVPSFRIDEWKRHG